MTSVNKAILVIDMPENCGKCPCFQFGMDNYCGVNDKVSWDWNTKRLDDCPLKPFPQSYNWCDSDFEYGYNACINKILKE